MFVILTSSIHSQPIETGYRTKTILITKHYVYIDFTC